MQNLHSWIAFKFNFHKTILHTVVNYGTKKSQNQLKYTLTRGKIKVRNLMWLGCWITVARFARNVWSRALELDFLLPHFPLFWQLFDTRNDWHTQSPHWQLTMTPLKISLLSALNLAGQLSQKSPIRVKNFMEIWTFISCFDRKISERSELKKINFLF